MKAGGRNDWMVARGLERASSAWVSAAPVVFVPRTEQDYERPVAVLDALIDAVGEDVDHPLASLMEVIGTLIEKYDDEHVPEFGA
jgi:HTH-type transcriptional regulator/antitoxin HigA